MLGAIIGGAAAIGSALISRSSGGQASGTTTQQVTPATFDEDQQVVWDDFLGQIYGVSPETLKPAPEIKKDEKTYADIYKGVRNTFDLDPHKNKALSDFLSKVESEASSIKEANTMIQEFIDSKKGDAVFGRIGTTAIKREFSDYAKNFAQEAVLEKVGIVSSEGEIPESSSSFLEKLQEDDAFLKETYTKYLSDTDIERQSLIDALSGYQADIGEYRGRGEQAREDIGRIGEETLRPVSIGVGGRNIPFIPGAATRSYEALRQPVLDRRTLDKEIIDAALQSLGVSEKKYGANLGALQEALGLAPQMAPNVAAKQYMDFLSPIAMQLQGLRYGVPTTTQTGTYQPSLLNTLGTAIDTYSQIKGLLQPTQQQPAVFETVPEVPEFQSQYFG